LKSDRELIIYLFCILNKAFSLFAGRSCTANIFA